MAASSTSTPGWPFSIRSLRSVLVDLPSSATLAFIPCWTEKGLEDVVSHHIKFGIWGIIHPFTSLSRVMYSFVASLGPRSSRYTM